jgi:DNA replication protein DnaC
MKSITELVSEAMAGARVVPDEELEARDRQDRLVESRQVLGRLPAFARVTSAKELLGCVKAQSLARVAKTWKPSEGGLLLLGMTGVGKTSAAAWLFRRLVHEGVKSGGEAWSFATSMHWYSAVELEEAHREHPLGKGTAPEIVTASHASLLFIDDAGRERDPRVVSSVLNERYELCRPTVITSGKTREEFDEKYDGAVTRRFNQAGGRRATVVNLHGRTAA